eukprot:755206-Hanusia_phi.AAC.5
MKASAAGYVKTCEYLLQSKANANAKDRSGATALFKVVHSLHGQLLGQDGLFCRLHRGAGAKINVKDAYRKTVMDYSTEETKEILRTCYGIVENRLLLQEKKLTSEEAAARILEIGYAAL